MRRGRESVLSEILPPEERVIEAVVARYQRVAPAVTRIARSIAGNEKLTVRLGSQAAAGPDEIVIDPGVFQAAYGRSAPVTPTEVALTSALHEAVHLLATDLEERRPIPETWLAHGQREQRVAATSVTEAITEVLGVPNVPDLDDTDGWPDDDDYDADAEVDFDVILAASRPDTDDERTGTIAIQPAMRLLEALNEVGGPAAEAMFMSLEDARQERRHFADFRGARSVLSDLYTAALPDALRDARPLGQFATACFMIVGGYVTRPAAQKRVAAHVAAAIDDAMAFLRTAARTSDPWEVGTTALQLLEVARLHGIVSDAGDSPTKTTRDLADDADRNAISDSVDAVRIVTPPLQDMASYEDTRAASLSVSTESGRKGEVEQAGDPATDQVVKVSESPTVYLPTGQAGKLVVAAFPERFAHFGVDGRILLDEAAAHWEVRQRRVSGELYPLFLANQRRGLRSGYDAGDLSPYAALLLGGGLYNRMFERRDLAQRRSYAVSLLVDGSASMLQPRPGPGHRKTPWAMAAATLGAWTLANLCDELQIECEVALFNRSFAADIDDSERSFSRRRHAATGALRRSQGGAAERLTRTVNHYLVKPFDRQWRGAEDVMAGLFWAAAKPAEAVRSAQSDPENRPPVSMFDKAANVDEFNVAYAATRLADRRANTRIMVVLADGMTRGSVKELAAAVEAVEMAGTTVLGIGIGDNTVTAAYARHQVVERPDVLAKAMVNGVRSTLYKSLAAMGGHGWWAQPTNVLRDDTTRAAS